MTNKRRQAVSAACLAVLASVPAASATDIFSTLSPTVATGTAAWSTAGNWINNPAIVAFPNNDGNNTFETTVTGIGVGTTQLTLSQNITVSSLSFYNAALLGGSSSGAGFSMNVLGAFDNANGGSFRLATGAILNLGGADTISGGPTISGDTNSAINILAGGTFTSTGAALTTISVPFNNNGAVSVTAGTLSFQGGGSGAGSFTVATGATLETISNFTGGAVANNGLLNIARLSNATFDTISGTGTLTMPSFPTTLTATRITQGTMNVDGGTITLKAPSTVTNLKLTSASSSPVFYGSATDNTSVPTSTVSLTVPGVFNGAANFTLDNGIILNLAGTGSFSGNNIDGGTNAQINIQAGAVIQHNVNNTTYIDDALTTVNGELDVSAGSFNIFYGGTHTGTFNVSSGAYLAAGGAFSTAAKVNDSGSFYIIPSAGSDSDPTEPGFTGHNFSGTLTMQPGSTLGFQGVGLPSGAVYFTNQSTLSMGSSTTLNSVSGTTAVFNNQQALTIGTANFGGGVIFRNPGLNIGTANLATGELQIENTGTVTIGTLNQTGAVSDNILVTGAEDGLATTLSVGTFNLSGGQEDGKIVVNNVMNWSGGVIAGAYGDVIIPVGATLNEYPGAGQLSQSGKIEAYGTVNVQSNLYVGDANNSASVYTANSGTTTVAGTLGVGNAGTLTGGSSTSSGTYNATGTSQTTAKIILLGNASGGAGALLISQQAQVSTNGVSVNDATISGGTLTVTTDTNTSDNLDPVINGSIVGGYLRSGQINVNGGSVTAPFVKLGVTANNTGTFTQTAGSGSFGVFGAGNSGTLTSGSGVGTVTVSGGSLYADTLLLGSTTGGTADMTVSNTASVTIGGGAHLNDLNVNGGTVTVLDQAPPAGEDPELNRALVGGYLTNGALNVNGGVVTSPMLKLGITSGNTGTFTQTAGSATFTTLSAGNDGTLGSGSGTGIANVSGGNLFASTLLLGSTAGGSGDMTVSGSASVTIGGGAHLNDLNVNGGTVTVLDQAPPAGEDPELNRALVGGYLTNGALNVNGGTVVSPLIKLGITGGMTGTFTESSGSVTVGTFGVGNDASLTSGSGIGMATVSGGTLFINTLLLGDTNGGTGSMILSGTASVTIAGGSHLNDLTVNSGSVTVLDQAPPAGEDPELNRALVGGYLSNGALYVNGGLVTAPYIKLGISSGYTGTFAQTGGVVSVGTLCIGNDVVATSGSGVGSTVISGGSLSIGTLQVGSTAGGVGTMNISGTASVKVTKSLTLVAGSSGFGMSGGTFTLDTAPASLASNAIAIGDGTTPTILHLHNTTLAGTNASLTIAPHATLDGGGADLSSEGAGSVLLQSTSLAFSGSNAILHMALGGDPTVGANAGVTFDQIRETGGIFTVGGATLQILPLSTVVLNQPYPIVVVGAGGSISYTQPFSNLTTDPTYGSAASYAVSYSATEIDVTFSAAPEPASGAVLLLGACGVLSRRRRRTLNVEGEP